MEFEAHHHRVGLMEARNYYYCTIRLVLSTIQLTQTPLLVLSMRMLGSFGSFRRRCSSSQLLRRINTHQRTRHSLTSRSISSTRIFKDSVGSTSNVYELDQKQRSSPLALVFDTETSGMYNFDKSEVDPAQPALMQLGMILVDAANWEPKLQTSMLVQSEVPFVLEQGAFDAHGITVLDCQRYGVPQAMACQLFRHLLTRADCLVAHNLDFDLRIMRTAMLRSSVTVPRLDELQRICTMKDYTKIFKISSDFGDRYKWPSLQEAFRHFTDCEMDGGHDAMVDAEACLTVFRNLVDCGAAELKERAVDKDDRIARELLEHRSSTDEPNTSAAPPVSVSVSATRNSNNGTPNVADPVAARPGELYIILDPPTDKAMTPTANENDDTVGGFRISGNTYKYHKQIRALGGCTWSRAARAWVFHDRSRLAAARQLVNSAPLSQVAPVGKNEADAEWKKIFDQ